MDVFIVCSSGVFGAALVLISTHIRTRSKKKDPYIFCPQFSYRCNFFPCFFSLAFGKCFVSCHGYVVLFVLYCWSGGVFFFLLFKGRTLFIGVLR